jgi:hypothetical protein
MLRDCVGSFARKSDERVGRCEVDNSSAPNVTCTVPAAPGLGFLLAHRCYLCTHAEHVATGIDVHDAVKVLNVSLSEGCMHAVVDLRSYISWKKPQAIVMTYSCGVHSVV